MRVSSLQSFVLRPALMLAMTSAFVLPTQAGDVFSKPPAPGGTINISSWVPPNGTGADTYAWDDFTLPFDQTITEVHWRGGYAQGAFFGEAYDFRVSFFNSLPGGSQPLITAFPEDEDLETVIATFHSYGNAGQTPAGSSAGVLVYDYNLVLPTPVTLQGGVKYWFRVLASQPTYPDWGLVTGAGGDAVHFRFLTGQKVFQTAANDLAFSLAAQWVNLGQGLAGAGGAPTLTASGSLIGGSSGALVLTNALPATSFWMVLGLSQLNASFKGGTLVPAPDVVLVASTDASGVATLSFVMPVGVPAAIPIICQAWISDASAAAGLAASNGLASSTP